MRFSKRELLAHGPAQLLGGRQRDPAAQHGGWKTGITDVFCTEEAVAYEPVFFWKRIRRGASFILAHVLAGWQALTQGMVRVV